MCRALLLLEPCLSDRLYGQGGVNLPLTVLNVRSQDIIMSGTSASRPDVVTGPYRPFTSRAVASVQLHETGHSCIFQHPSRDEGQEGGTKPTFSSKLRMSAVRLFQRTSKLAASKCLGLPAGLLEGVPRH